jgi:hypothetical protein
LQPAAALPEPVPVRDRDRAHARWETPPHAPPSSLALTAAGSPGHGRAGSSIDVRCLGTRRRRWRRTIDARLDEDEARWILFGRDRLNDLDLRRPSEHRQSGNEQRQDDDANVNRDGQQKAIPSAEPPADGYVFLEASVEVEVHQ